jgi:formylglycine-generating enzyme required for sulfatase activity/beta-lactamase regulating signal transducer with metallopeptidase domain
MPHILWTESSPSTLYWAGLLLDAAAKSTTLLILALLAARLLRRASASTRHLLWLCSLAALLLLPILSACLPAWQILPIWRTPIAATPATPFSPGPWAGPPPSAPNTSAQPESIALPSHVIAPETPAAILPPSAIPPLPPPRQISIDALHAILILWTLGALAAMSPLLLSLFFLTFRRNMSPIHAPTWITLLHPLRTPLRIPRSVHLLRSRTTLIPMTFGILRPAIVLPPDADTWPADRRRMVLLHELSHIKRWDCLTHLLARLACAGYWFHPLAWLALRHLSIERERACDDMVLRAGTKSSTYASELLTIASTLHPHHATAHAALAMARPSTLEGRLLAILDTTRNRTRLATTTIILTTFAVAISASFLAILHADETPANPALQTVKQWAAEHNAKAQSITPTTLESHWGGAWRDIPFSLDKDEEADARACVALANKTNSSINGKTEFSDPATRTALEDLLKRRPNYFYAEFLLAQWHRDFGDAQKAAILLDAAYRHAPVIIVQRYQFADGSPLAHTPIQSFALECNRVQKGWLDPSLEFQYHDLRTDADGCIYLPVYNTVYRRDNMASPHGYSVAWPTLGWFETSRKVALLPIATVSPEPGDFIHKERPSAKMRVLSTPEEHAQGKFHWLIVPDRALALVFRCTLLETPDHRIFPGAGTSQRFPDSRPVEILGSRTVTGGATVLHLKIFYPAPHSVPMLQDSSLTSGFVDRGDAYTNLGTAGNLTELTEDYVPFAWADMTKQGHPVGTVFCLVRVVATDQQQSALSADPPLESLRIPATLPAQSAATATAASTDQQTRIYELIYVLRHSAVASRQNETYGAVRELVQIGRPAVPALCVELEHTDRDCVLRTIPLALRIIGDPRAIPALIHALPKTRIMASDLGCAIIDRDIWKFLNDNRLPGRKGEEYPAISVPRADTQIINAINSLSGEQLSATQAYGFYGDQTPEKIKGAETVRQVEVGLWQQWWSAHWKELITQQELDSLNVPARTDDPVETAGLGRFGPLFPTGSGVKLGPIHDVLLSPSDLFDTKTWIDFDTGKTYALFEGGHALKYLDTADLLRWLATTGIDANATTFVKNPEEKNPQKTKYIYGLSPQDLTAWPVDNARWDTLDTELASGKPLDLGKLSPRRSLESVDLKTGEYEFGKLPSTFLFITREGGRGILQILASSDDPPGIKFRYRMFQGFPGEPGTAPVSPPTTPPNLSFSAETKLTLHAPASPEPSALDLDTGKMQALPDHPAHPSAATAKWCATWGGDVVSNPDRSGKIYDLLCSDMVVCPVTPEGWNMSPAEVRDIVTRRAPEPISQIYEHSEQPHPATFLFKTREGAAGVVQLVPNDDDSPTITFRYKLIVLPDSSIKPVGTAPATTRTSPTQPSTVPSSQAPLNPSPKNPAKELTLNLGDKVTMKLALIPAGDFIMGSPPVEKYHMPDESPQHHVKISHPFYMGVYDVTQEQYRLVMGRRPSGFEKWQEGNYPVGTVSWEEASEFCNKLSQITGKVVQLPTEAQWEYTCRAGSTTMFSYGDDETKLDEYAWYEANSYSRTHPVGQKKPNAFGLYDLHGNVAQWCSDWYGPYPDTDLQDPTGPAQGRYHVLRGGSGYGNLQSCRSAARYWIGPAQRAGNHGFRVTAAAAPS